MKLSKLKFFAIGMMMLVIVFLYVTFLPSRPRGCVMEMNRLIISTVAYGCFVEFIPQTGVCEIDNIARCHNVKVPIDQFYMGRIEPGLEATTTFNNKDYTLAVTYVDHTITDGRFSIEMNFCDGIPQNINGKNLRLRIELTEPSTQLLLPVGSFYKDTGGKWIYVVEDGFAVRRNIKLGRKAGAEHFEVLEGLEPGDHVITSSYEKFENAESLELAELESLYGNSSVKI